MLVTIQVSVLGLYLPPVFKKAPLPPLLLYPPQTIISLPVHTAVWKYRALGALVLLVTIQVSVAGLYLPPLFKSALPALPPHTIISLPVQIAVG